MKVKDLEIAMSPITGEIYIGKISKDRTHWIGEKKPITEMFDRIAEQRAEYLKNNPQKS